MRLKSLNSLNRHACNIICYVHKVVSLLNPDCQRTSSYLLDIRHEHFKSVNMDIPLHLVAMWKLLYH